MEEVTSGTPTEATNQEDFFDDVNESVIKENESTDSENESNVNQSDSENVQESETAQNESDDYTPLLEKLGREVKYNGEGVEIKSKDDLITLVQKGLNYDKKNKQYEDLENSKGVAYIHSKAKELGMSDDEYISEVMKYEEREKKQKEQQRLEDMISNGVPEDVAKEVIATGELRRQLQAKENELKEKEEANKKESEKNKEYEKFLSKYPDVKPDSIPREVFENAKDSNLTEAYTEYLVKKLQDEVEVYKKNASNSSKVVGATTEQGTKENKAKDEFLMGFES